MTTRDDPRILFVRTDLKDPNRALSPPLGLMYLASVLRKEAVKPLGMEIFDMRLYSQALPALVSRIRELKPRMVGISTVSFEAQVMHQVAETVKKMIPDCRVIVGGPHATVCYDRILEDKNVDFAVVGEGEKSLVELANHILGGGQVPPLPGVAARENGKVVFPGMRPPIENLDSLPFPAWDLINLDAYLSLRFIDMNRNMRKGRYMGLFTSRGCPYGCLYCHSIFGKGFRSRSPENVLEEIKILTKNYGVKEFQIFDDCFNFNPDRAKRIGEMISTQVPGIRLAFPNGIRGDIVDREFLEIYRRAGAYTVTMAVETASPRLQKLIRKNLNLEKVREAILCADRLKYFVQGFFMLGFPTETREEIRETIRFAVESPLGAATFFTVVPFPRTGLAQLIEEMGFSEKVELSNFHYYAKNTYFQLMTGLNLKAMQRQAYLRFYLNPLRLLKGISRAPNKRDFIVTFFLYGIRTFFGDLFR
jgi:radical SAM superfamily enzyme YgiQ (UPF0313 family)